MKRWVDRVARVGMVVGVGLMLEPWSGQGLRWGFFATAGFTLLHIVTSHWELADEQASSQALAQDQTVVEQS
jgi:hypothetical protein